MTSTLREAARSVKRARLEWNLRRAQGDAIKRANAELNWREFWHKRTELRSYPRLVQVGTNWTCNLRCNFCRLTMDSFQSWLRQKPPQEFTISDRVLEQVLELMPYPETITLTPLGEPMLYSKFGLILEHHARIGSRNLAMTSNLNLVNDERARMLVESGINHIYVSVDSPHAETYAGMRVRGDLAKVEAALERINHWKRELKSETPTLTLASTFMERNVRHMADLVDFAVKHGFTTYSVQLMEVENPELEGEFLGNHIAITKEMVLQTLKRAEGKPVDVRIHLALRNLLTASLSMPEFKAISAATDLVSAKDGEAEAKAATSQSFDRLSTKGTHLTEKCNYPWYFMVIDTDGDCRPCCWTAMSFGNLNKLEFQEIWNCDTARGMRRDFLNNHIPKVCQGKHCRVDLNHYGTME